MMMLDVEQAQPALLAHGEGDKTTKLHKLGLGKMFIHSLPKRIIGIQMPRDGLGIGQRSFLPFVIPVRLLKVQQLIVLRLFEARFDRFDGTLIAAVLAVDRS